MMIHPVTNIIDGQPCFDKPLSEILGTLKMGEALKTLTKAEYNTLQQVAWWKGILLPALSDDNGESKACWEIRLKLEVLPDDFQPVVTQVGTSVFANIPSITVLGKIKMTELIQGSVQHLREDPKYDGKYQWVTLPDSALRKKK
jgi:hypothetical protein